MKNLIKITGIALLSIWANAAFSQTVLVSPTDDIDNGTDYCDPVSIEASNKVTLDGFNVGYKTEPTGYILLTDGFEATAFGTGYFEASIIDECFVASKETEIPNQLIGEISTYPNPFTDYFELGLDLKEYASIDLVLFDETGKVFNALLSNQSLSVGNQSLTFDTKSFPSGIYFYQLGINGYRQSGKITCIR